MRGPLLTYQHRNALHWISHRTERQYAVLPSGPFQAFLFAVLNNRFFSYAVAVKGPPPLVHLWQNLESIRDDNIFYAMLAQEARLCGLVAPVGVSLWPVMSAPHPVVGCQGTER